jgi:hypothetical protein
MTTTTPEAVTARASGPARARFNWRSVPGGVITEHIHPRQEERFTILAGEAHFTLNGEQRIAGAGETIIVPAGVPHSEGNPGPGEIEGSSNCARHCSPRSSTRPWLASSPTARPRLGAHPRTPSSSAQPSGTSATKAGSAHPRRGAEPHAPAAVGAGQTLRHTALLRPLEQPDLSSWLRPPHQRAPSHENWPTQRSEHGRWSDATRNDSDRSRGISLGVTCGTRTVLRP